MYFNFFFPFSFIFPLLNLWMNAIHGVMYWQGIFGFQVCDLLFVHEHRAIGWAQNKEIKNIYIYIIFIFNILYI